MWAAACSTSCGPGTRQRFRQCDNPPKSENGNHCNGTEMEIVECNLEECRGKVLINTICHNISDENYLMTMLINGTHYMYKCEDNTFMMIKIVFSQQLTK